MAKPNKPKAMNAEEYLKLATDKTEAGYLIKDNNLTEAVVKLMEQYHQSKLRDELIEFADFIDDKVLEMVKVQRPIELVDEYLKQKEQ